MRISDIKNYLTNGYFHNPLSAPTLKGKVIAVLTTVITSVAIFAAFRNLAVSFAPFALSFLAKKYADLRNRTTYGDDSQDTTIQKVNQFETIYFELNESEDVDGNINWNGFANSSFESEENSEIGSDNEDDLGKFNILPEQLNEELAELLAEGFSNLFTQSFREAVFPSYSEPPNEFKNEEDVKKNLDPEISRHLDLYIENNPEATLKEITEMMALFKKMQKNEDRVVEIQDEENTETTAPRLQIDYFSQSGENIWNLNNFDYQLLKSMVENLKLQESNFKNKFLAPPPSTTREEDDKAEYFEELGENYESEELPTEEKKETSNDEDDDTYRNWGSEKLLHVEEKNEETFKTNDEDSEKDKSLRESNQSNVSNFEESAYVSDDETDINLFEVTSDKIADLFDYVSRVYKEGIANKTNFYNPGEYKHAFNKVHSSSQIPMNTALTRKGEVFNANVVTFSDHVYYITQAPHFNELKNNKIQKKENQAPFWKLAFGVDRELKPGVIIDLTLPSDFSTNPKEGAELKDILTAKKGVKSYYPEQDKTVVYRMHNGNKNTPITVEWAKNTKSELAEEVTYRVTYNEELRIIKRIHVSDWYKYKSCDVENFSKFVDEIYNQWDKATPLIIHGPDNDKKSGILAAALELKNLNKKGELTSGNFAAKLQIILSNGKTQRGETFADSLDLVTMLFEYGKRLLADNGSKEEQD
ncbi:MAG: hypothetical protein Tsb0021_07410 [Chlamydiales bacterium]